MASNRFLVGMRAVRTPRLSNTHAFTITNHPLVSWAGLLYLTLFLASKFAVAIPFLPPRPFSTNPAYTSAATRSNIRKSTFPLSQNNTGLLPTHKQNTNLSQQNQQYGEDDIVPIRYQAAAPPVWTLVLVLVPIGSAIYVTSTRFTDYRHHGFDLIFGALIGITTAWFSFRWYHLPITRGAGWSWGPRSYNRTWGIGVGVGSYVGPEGWSHKGEGEGTPGMQNPNGQSSLTGLTESEMHPGYNGVRNEQGSSDGYMAPPLPPRGVHAV